MLLCPKCGARASSSDERFCGFDGTPLERRPVSSPASLSSPASAKSCPRCGAPSEDGGDGYCISCGQRLGALSSAPPSSAPPSNVPLEGDLPFEEEPAFGIAFSVHPGLRRDHSEDAAAMASGTTRRGDPFRVLVVCDGVSSSTHAEQASQVAARMVRDSLAQFCRTRGTAVESARQAMREALGEAHEAICAQRFELGAKEPPGTTCVAALVLRSRLIVGWVGDSRAYWLREEGGAELLTRDHSWANERVARGEATLEQAMRAPNAYALTRCLGPAELGEAFQPVQPDVVTRSLAGRGTVILCTDGLSNYYPIPEQMAALIKRCGPCPTPGRLARFLIHKALSRGGQDNVSVAVYQHRPGQSK